MSPSYLTGIKVNLQLLRGHKTHTHLRRGPGIQPGVEGHVTAEGPWRDCSKGKMYIKITTTDLTDYTWDWSDSLYLVCRACRAARRQNRLWTPSPAPGRAGRHTIASTPGWDTGHEKHRLSWYSTRFMILIFVKANILSINTVIRVNNCSDINVVFLPEKHFSYI